MDASAIKRYNRLLEIAQNDGFYQQIERMFENRQEEYSLFFRSQPQEVQAMLWGYTRGSNFMYQWLAKLACEHMVFPDE